MMSSLFGPAIPYRIKDLRIEDFDPVDASIGGAPSVSDAPAPPVEELDRVAVFERLAVLGLTLGGDANAFDAETVIVACMDADPLVLVHQQVLRESPEALLAALPLARKLAAARRVIVAAPEPLSREAARAAGDQAEVMLIPPRYPNGLADPLARAVRARARSGGRCLIIRAERLLSLQEALRAGAAPDHKIVTLIGRDGQPLHNLRVRLGTPVGEILARHDLTPVERGKLILGGPFQGEAARSLEQTVSPRTDALFVQAPDDVVHPANQTCLNCGACVDACPIRLNVNLISRFAEYDLFDRALEHGAEQCFECGLCGFVCPAGRSLVQYVRLVKQASGTRGQREGS